MRSTLAAVLSGLLLLAGCGVGRGSGGAGGGSAGGTSAAGGGSGGGLGSGGGSATGGGLASGGGAGTGGGLSNDGGERCVPGTTAELGDGGIRIPPDAGSARDGGLSAVVSWFDFHPYTGTAEPGVRCSGSVCDAGTPCCLTCSTAACGACTGAPSTPVACDGPEDCPALNDVCCFTAAGAACTPTSACAITIPSLDAGFVDGGFLDTALDQGLRVCNRTLDCRVLLGEICCSSSQISRLDLGLCVPFPLCP